MNESKEIKGTSSKFLKKELINKNKGRNNNKLISSSIVFINYNNEEMKNADINMDNLEKINSIFESKSIDDNNYYNSKPKNLEDEKEIENQLILIYDKFVNYYKDKKYDTLLKEVSQIKRIYNVSSDTPYKIFMIKIRCLLKAFKKQFAKLLKISNPINLAELLKIISKIMKDFENISKYISPNHTKNYEEITQIYAKFLLYLSLFSKQKEEYIKSMTYTTLGINLLKLFFIRRKVAESTKTYMIFIQLLLLQINYLIGDNNIIAAIYYCQMLFRLLEVTYRIMSQSDLPKKYYLKFLEYSGYNCLYFGVCLEQIIDITKDDSCFIAYRQARYFLNIVEKNKPKTKSFIQLITKSNNENMAFLLSKFLIDKYQKLVEREKSKVKLLKYIHKEKKAKKEKILDIDKLENMRQKKYKLIEKKIYKDILTPNNQINIEKLDNELISVLYPKKNYKATPLSHENKKFLCNFKLQSILMSNDFRKYIVENEKLQFNNPFTEKQSIQGLQRYLNKNIKVSDISDSPINNDKKLQKMSLNNESTENKINLKRIEKNKNNKDSKIILHKNILKKFTFKNKSLSSKNIFSSTKNSENSDSKKIINPFLSYNQPSKIKKKFILKRNQSNKSLSKKISSETDLSKTIKEDKNISFDYFKLLKNKKKTVELSINNNKKIKNANIKNIIRSKLINSTKFKYSNSYSFLENDFERKYLDKSILTSKYSKNISYLDSFTTKELAFQKTMLKLKGNSSKMFIDTYEQDLNNNYNYRQNIRENAYSTFLFLKDKANDQVSNNQIEDYNDKKSQPNILEDSSHIFKVFNKYVQSSREKAAKRLKVYSQSYKNVKRNNEVRLLNLNKGLKELNSMITYKNQLMKDFFINKDVK